MPTNFTRLLFLFATILSTSAALSAQNIILGQADQVSTCSGRLFDSGGPNSPHGRDSLVITVCPDYSEGSHLRALFLNLDIVGTLRVYNASTADPAAFIDAVNTASAGRNPAFRASAANTDGCLTFVFVPEASTPGAGFDIQFSCVTPCQPIEAVLLSADPVPVPNDATGYIDICPGDLITLQGSANYPEDGVIYNQDNSTSTFTWNFQNGDRLTGQTVTYEYTEAGGYVVQLTVEDDRGCRNANRIGQRVRVAPRPIFAVGDIPESICPGESVDIDASNDPSTGATVTVTPPEFSFVTGQSRTDTVPLPDGSGVDYSSPLEFTNFDPGQVITDGSEIVSICASISHDYLGDLNIKVACPNGRELLLHRFDRGNEVAGQTLGNAERDNNSLLQDTPGLYCWTANATETMTDVVRRRNLRLGDKLPEGDYAAETSFDVLAGCELNGEWSIIITDQLAQDDGVIYEWSIEFASDVYPEQEVFSVPISAVTITENAGYANYSPTAATLRTNNPGPKETTISSLDDFGCTYDTTFTTTVRSPFAPDCVDCTGVLRGDVRDTMVCPGSTVQLEIDLDTPQDTTVIWEALDNQDISRGLHGSRNTAYESVITVTDHVPATLTTPGGTIAEVCLNLPGTGGLARLNVELENPGGGTTTLLENFSPGGSALTQTCFSVAATADIATAAAPFTGTYRASGNWANQIGTAINGDWQLRIWDNSGNDISRLASWSIGLIYDRSFRYEWINPDATFSCTDCPNPTITVDSERSYTVRVIQADGCSEEFTGSVSFLDNNINVTDNITRPTCADGDDGAITLTANQPNVTDFAWSTGAMGPTITGLTAGDYTVTITNSNGCDLIETYTVPATDAITFDVSASATACAGDNNGSVTVANVAGPNAGDFTIQWDAAAGSQTTFSLTGLAPGTYTFVVTDAAGCEQAGSATIATPNALLVSLLPTAVSCSGADDGSIMATATGGTPPYNFAWSSGETTADIDMLMPGEYIVTVSDASGCTVMDTTTIIEPGTLSVTAVADSVRCIGQPTGRVTIMPVGGTGPFTYALNQRSGSLDSIFTGLVIGEYTARVTDANGCTASVAIDVVNGEPFTVTLPPDTTLVFPDSLILQPVLTGVRDSIFFEWRPSAPTAISCLDCQNPTIRPEFPGTYRLLVSDRNGCTVEDEIEILVRKVREVAVPTGFSPNGDGQNDVLIVHGRPGTMVEVYQVFDRWANLLYEEYEFPVNDVGRGWDGRKDDELVNAGVYFYKLRVRYEDGSTELLSGQTTLIR